MPPPSPPPIVTPSASAEEPAAILLCTANAVERDRRLRLDEELRAIDKALTRSRLRDHFRYFHQPVCPKLLGRFGRTEVFDYESAFGGDLRISLCSHRTLSPWPVDPAPTSSRSCSGSLSCDDNERPPQTECSVFLDCYLDCRVGYEAFEDGATPEVNGVTPEDAHRLCFADCSETATPPDWIRASIDSLRIDRTLMSFPRPPSEVPPGRNQQLDVSRHYRSA